MMSFASSLRVRWVREQVFAQEAQILGARAYDAVNRWVLGQGGKPRFKSTSRGLHSMECKDELGSMRPVLAADGSLAGVQWGRGLVIPARVTPPGGRRRTSRRAHEREIAKHVQAGRVLHTRIIRSRVNGRWAYRTQFVIGAPAPVRHPISSGLVGLDIGPSTVAMVTDTTIALERFCDKLRDNRSEVRRLQRKQDRQHRAGSPGCFDAQGRHRNGRCGWWRTRSKRATRTLTELRGAHRRLAAHRKSLHGNVANRVLSHGRMVNTEKLSYRAFQRSFGRSVRDHAPGTFIQSLRRKAVSAGGGMLEFDTRTTALSQTCICGTRERKPLNQRQHCCPRCGFRAQRDVLSAFLARHVHRHVNPETEAVSDRLDAPAARKAAGLRQDLGARPASSLIFNRRAPVLLAEAGHIPPRVSELVGRNPELYEPAPTATSAVLEMETARVTRGNPRPEGRGGGKNRRGSPRGTEPIRNRRSRARTRPPADGEEHG
jgi:putative transposase